MNDDNEVELTDKELRQIAELAHREFVDKHPKLKKEHLFLCECYVKAIVSFFTAKKLNIKKGKIVYEYED